MHFPNESESYRQARQRLLEAEIALRDQAEEVAALRRQLPPGGLVQEDYLFEGLDSARQPHSIRLSDLFERHSTEAGAAVILD